jgi:hypothetical protein
MATKFPPVDLSPKREVVVKARWERTISVAPYEPERVEISAHLDLQVRDADVEAEVEMAAEKLAKALTRVGLVRVNERLVELGRQVPSAPTPPEPTEPDVFLGGLEA